MPEKQSNSHGKVILVDIDEADEEIILDELDGVVKPEVIHSV